MGLLDAHHYRRARRLTAACVGVSAAPVEVRRSTDNTDDSDSQRLRTTTSFMASRTGQEHVASQPNSQRKRLNWVGT